MSRDKFIGERRRESAEAIVSPDYETDVSLLGDLLKWANGNIYFVSGEANHQVYNALEPYLKKALDREAIVYFFTGPIMSVPDGNGGQEDRVKTNAIA